MNGKHLGWLAGVVLGGAVGLGGVAVAAPAKVYVADEEGNTVTVLDLVRESGQDRGGAWAAQCPGLPGREAGG